MITKDLYDRNQIFEHVQKPLCDSIPSYDCQRPTTITKDHPRPVMRPVADNQRFSVGGRYKHIKLCRRLSSDWGLSNHGHMYIYIYTCTCTCTYIHMHGHCKSNIPRGNNKAKQHIQCILCLF